MPARAYAPNFLPTLEKMEEREQRPTTPHDIAQIYKKCAKLCKNRSPYIYINTY